MLLELRDKKDIMLLRLLIDKYHNQGCPPGGGAARGSRWFVWVEEGYWLAGAWIHDSTPFRFIALQYGIPLNNSYFIRRITRFTPIECNVAFLRALAEKLKHEGKEALWTLGLPRHSNALYKNAGFQHVGNTKRSGHPVYVLWLQ